MPSIKIKKGGAYADPVNIFVKKAGAYAPVVGIFAKVAAAYVPIFTPGGAKRTSVVATRGGVPTEGTDVPGQIMTRSGHALTDDVTAVQLVFGNWIGDEGVTGGSATVQASVEYPVGTAPKAVTFGGNASVTIPAGGQVISDPVTIGAATSGSQIAVRNLFVGAAGFPYFTSGLQGINGIDAAEFANNGTVTNRVMDLTAIPNSSGGIQYRPLAIIGLTAKKMAAVVGDSTTYGQGSGPQNVRGDMGEITPSLPADVVHINFAVPGSSAGLALNGAAFSARFAKRAQMIADWATHVIFDFGKNDLNEGATDLNARRVQFAALLPTKSVVPTTIAPAFTASTDQWATQANQTASSREGNRVAYNAQVRALPLFIDIAKAMNPADDGKWPTNGSANGFTADGIHPNTAGYARIPAAIPNAFAAWLNYYGAS